MPTLKAFDSETFAHILNDVLFQGRPPLDLNLRTVANGILQGGKEAGKAYALLGVHIRRGTSRGMAVLENREQYLVAGLDDFHADCLRWAIDGADAVMAGLPFEGLSNPAIAPASATIQSQQDADEDSEKVRQAFYATLRPSAQIAGAFRSIKKWVEQNGANSVQNFFVKRGEKERALFRSPFQENVRFDSNDGA